MALKEFIARFLTSLSLSFYGVSRKGFAAKTTVPLLFIITRTFGEPVTCDVPSVALQSEARLTCHFPENVGQSQKDITVYRYADHEKPESVLDCWWLKGQLDCFIKKGFEFDKVVTDHLTVRIPHVSNTHQGTFVCQVAGYDPQDLKTCELILDNESPVTCKIYSGDEKSILTCYFPEDISVSKKDFTVYHFTGQGRPDAVVDCLWLSGKFKCLARAGYKTDLAVTDKIKVQIPYSSSNQTSAYSCQILGSKSHNVEPCQPDLLPVSSRLRGEQTVIENTSQSDQNTSQSGQITGHSDLITGHSDQSTGGSDQSPDDRQDALVIGIVTGITITLLITLVASLIVWKTYDKQKILMCFNRLRRQKQHGGTSSTPPSGPRSSYPVLADSARDGGLLVSVTCHDHVTCAQGGWKEAKGVGDVCCAGEKLLPSSSQSPRECNTHA